MTIKSYLRRRLIFFVAVFLLGGGIFQVQVHMHDKNSPLGTAMALASGILVLIGLCGLFIFIRCPRCHRRFGNILSYMSLIPTSDDRGIKHCPYCGVNLDDPL